VYRLRSFQRALVGVATLGLAASAAPKANRATAIISPQRHDFGKAIVGSQVKASFRVQLKGPPNPDPKVWNRAAPIGVGILQDPVTGKADDFRVPVDIVPNPLGYSGQLDYDTSFRLDVCSGFQLPQTVDCTFDVYFVPKRVARQSAQLTVPFPGERWVGAVLTGEVTPGCVMKVVSCNYGPLYSGLFSWSRKLISPGSEHKESVQVKITDGVAKCLGTATDTENGRSITGIIDGPGLFAVEFEPDSHFPLAYRITAACPTPAYPAIPEDGVEATKSQPAELGHNDQNSEKQPAKEIAQASVEGTIQYEAPETDPVNGVTGTVAISWSLKRK
jgi:hypothetical protein